jgi:hypothetical protein
MIRTPYQVLYAVVKIKIYAWFWWGNLGEMDYLKTWVLMAVYINTVLTETGCEIVDRIVVAQNRSMRRAAANTLINFV